MSVLPGFKVYEILSKINELNEKQLQPAGVDLTLDKVFTFSSIGQIKRDNVSLPEVKELEGSKFFLKPGCYKIRFREIVEIPEDCIALAFPRSSLLRMGATINLAVWDPGYKGRGEALLIVTNPHGIILEKGARIVQIVYFRLEEKPKEKYSGQYQGENI